MTCREEQIGDCRLILGDCQRLSKRQRAATPIEFRDVLIGMARSVNGEAAE